jgi:uncharacterized tellurite resistance protein B-like protein
MSKQFDAIMSLSNEEKVAYLRAFTRLAKTDGQFDNVEKEYIKSIAKQYDVPATQIDEIFEIPSDDDLLQALSQIKNRRTALELIKDLCFLAHVDDELSDDETLFIGRVGQAMGVELEKIEQISSWVIEKIISEEEAKIIFEEL